MYFNCFKKFLIIFTIGSIVLTVNQTLCMQEYTQKELPEIIGSKLSDAIKNGNIEDTKELINKNPWIINLKIDKNDGYTWKTYPIILAIEANQPEILKFLLEKGANYEEKKFDGGIFPIRVSKKSETTKILLQHGINPEYANLYLDTNTIKSLKTIKTLINTGKIGIHMDITIPRLIVNLSEQLYYFVDEISSEQNLAELITKTKKSLLKNIEKINFLIDSGTDLNQLYDEHLLIDTLSMFDENGNVTYWNIFDETDVRYYRDQFDDNGKPKYSLSSQLDETLDGHILLRKINAILKKLNELIEQTQDENIKNLYQFADTNLSILKEKLYKNGANFASKDNCLNIVLLDLSKSLNKLCYGINQEKIDLQNIIQLLFTDNFYNHLHTSSNNIKNITREHFIFILENVKKFIIKKSDEETRPINEINKDFIAENFSQTNNYENLVYLSNIIEKKYYDYVKDIPEKTISQILKNDLYKILPKTIICENEIPNEIQEYADKIQAIICENTKVSPFDKLIALSYLAGIKFVNKKGKLLYLINDENITICLENVPLNYDFFFDGRFKDNNCKYLRARVFEFNNKSTKDIRGKTLKDAIFNYHEFIPVLFEKIHPSLFNAQNNTSIQATDDLKSIFFNEEENESEIKNIIPITMENLTISPDRSYKHNEFHKKFANTISLFTQLTGISNKNIIKVNNKKLTFEANTIPIDVIAKIISYTDGKLTKTVKQDKTGEYKTIDCEASYLPSTKFLPEIKLTKKFKEKYQQNQAETKNNNLFKQKNASILAQDTLELEEFSETFTNLTENQFILEEFPDYNIINNELPEENNFNPSIDSDWY